METKIRKEKREGKKGAHDKRGGKTRGQIFMRKRRVWIGHD